MSDDSDDVVVAPRGDHVSDDDLVVAPPVPAGGPGGALGPRGRRWAYPADGSFLIWLLVDASLPPPEG